MPIKDYSVTPASNSSIGGINIAEGCNPANVNNAIRQGMADQALEFATISDVAAAATVNLGDYAGIVRFSGSGTITSFGTAPAGLRRKLFFTSEITLAYNATSMILPDSANVTLYANDIGDAFSLGSGNWVVSIYRTNAINVSGTGIILPIDNGDMEIDQQNAGGTINVNNTIGYPVDRFYLNRTNSTGTTTAGQTSFAPNGFRTALVVTYTGGSAPAVNELAIIGTGIEGSNIKNLFWGTSQARSLTISFMVYSSVAGTYSLALWNSLTSRSFVTTYEINNAGTWEYKTITVPGTTTGTWASVAHSPGLNIIFDNGSGSNYQTSSLNVWQNGNFYRANGTVALPGTNSIFSVTGLGGNIGSSATPYLNLPYTEKLLACRRYYRQTWRTNVGLVNDNSYMTGMSNSAGAFRINWRFDTEMYFYTNEIATAYSSTTGTANTYRDVSSSSDRVITTPISTTNNSMIFTQSAAASANGFVNLHASIRTDRFGSI